jgi:hypothetical protein
LTFCKFCGTEETADHLTTRWLILAAISWALWKNRNDLVLSKIIPKPPKQVAYKEYVFFNQCLLAKEDKSEVEVLLLKMMNEVLTGSQVGQMHLKDGEETRGGRRRWVGL